MEQQRGGPLQERSLPQLESLDHFVVGFAENLGRQPLALRPQTTKLLQCPAVQLAEPDARQGDIVPGASVPLQQEACERGAFQHLLRAPAAVVELAPVTDRVRVRRHDDLDVLAAALRSQIHLDHDAEQRSHFGRDVLQQREDVAYSDDIAVVVPADLENAALRVREAADPGEVVVAPGALPLDALGLGRHGPEIRNGVAELSAARSTRDRSSPDAGDSADAVCRIPPARAVSASPFKIMTTCRPART